MHLDEYPLFALRDRTWGGFSWAQYYTVCHQEFLVTGRGVEILSLERSCKVLGVIHF